MKRIVYVAALIFVICRNITWAMDQAANENLPNQFKVPMVYICDDTENGPCGKKVDSRKALEKHISMHALKKIHAHRMAQAMKTTAHERIKTYNNVQK